MRTRSLRRTIGAVGLLATITLAAACGSDTTSESPDATDATAASIDAPAELTIAYQAIPNGDLIVKQQGLLEAALPDTKINWQIFDSGGAVNEAFRSGYIDLGLAGSSPVARGLSTGIDYRVVWIHDVIGEAEALVVRDGIDSIEDLAGKTIATPFSSTAHYSLLAALVDAGVDPTAVDIVNSEPAEIYSAWTADQIDGAYVWNPNLADIIGDGGKVLITSADLAADGTTTYDLGLASTEIAERYPDVLTAWAKAQDEAIALINDDPETAAEIIAAVLDIEPSEAADQLGDLILPEHPRRDPTVLDLRDRVAAAIGEPGTWGGSTSVATATTVESAS